MATVIRVPSLDDVFFGLSMLTPEALDALLGKPQKSRGPWWIQGGKPVIADAAAARVTTTVPSFAKLADLALRADCLGPALA